MKLQVIKNKILFGLRVTLLYGLYSITVLLLASFFILQIPYVQTRLAKWALASISQQTGFNAQIRGVEFYWFDRLRITGLKVTDPEGHDMFDIHSLRLNFSLGGLWGGHTYALDAALIDSASVHLASIKENDTLRNLNINVFVKRLVPASGRKQSPAPAIILGEVLLKNGTFIYNSARDSIRNGFDYNHFQLNIADAEIQQLFIQDDTVSMQVQSLQATDRKTGFAIRQLQTFFRLSDLSMEFLGLQLHAGKSYLADSVIFRFSGQEDLDTFTDSVHAVLHLKSAVLHPEDLALFAPEAGKLRQPLQLSANVYGRVVDFKCHDLDLQLGNTRLMGDLSMEGLPDINETFIVAELNHSVLDVNDLDFLFTPPTINQLNNLGPVHFKGQFLGYPTDFVANGEFTGKIGRIRSDINLKINEANPGLSAYSGRLQLVNFNLGLFLEDTLLFQRITLEGKIQGKGLTLETADFYLNGTINSLGIKNYNYSGITTNARFSNQLFTGSIAVADPNLALHINGTIDLRNHAEHLRMQGILDSVKLDQLNLSPEPLRISSVIDIDTYGFTLDSLRGTARLQDLKIFYIDETLAVNDLYLAATRSNNIRDFVFETSLFKVGINGNFNFSELFVDATQLLDEFRLAVINNKAEITEYYKKKKSRPATYQASFKVLLTDVNRLFDILDLPLHLTQNTTISGNFSYGSTPTFHAIFQTDTLHYQDKSFIKNELELLVSKSYQSNEIEAALHARSNKQSLSNNLTTEQALIKVNWKGNHAELEAGVSEPPNNKLLIQAGIDFKDDSTYLYFYPSAITLLDNTWMFKPNNYIAIKGKEWHFSKVTLSQADQHISLNGYLSADSTRALNLDIKRFSISFLSGLFGHKLAGVLDGNISLSKAYQTPSIENRLFLSALQVDNFLIGDVTGNNHWNNQDKRFELQFFIDRQGSRIIDFSGHYTPNTLNPLNGNATLNQAHLKIIEPFLADLFSRMQGTASGSCTITGSLDNPQLRGTIQITNGELMVNYLKTLYKFNGTVAFEPGSIALRNFTLHDVVNNNARLQGEIRHRAFADMQVNLSASFTDFQVLNTTQRDNELFYGQAYASGQATIQGPVNNLNLTVNAITRKNTRIFIPIGGTSVSEQKDFIRFVNFSDSTFHATESQVSKSMELTGFNMDFNLEVTPDAYSEIIFDIKSGDIIRGRGNGKLKLQINTDGEFTMFGPIEFTEGWYNFTLQNIINKEFQIKPGSRITWYGDPYQGVLDINASYNQLASLGPILNDPTLANSPAMKRKYPVEVLLKLEGPMLTPQISFDIQARDLPKSVPVEGRPPVALDLEFYSFKSRIDEQELKKQVFSLIVLRRFTPPESFSMSGSVTNSVSELLSNQLSYWMSQVDENLEIDVNLGAMDQEAFNTFQLRLSYTLLNGRMRITGDGTFNSQTATANQPGTFSSLAGDWTIDYLLTPDGKFKVKMFSRTNIDQNTGSINNQNTITTGVSLSYTQNFNAIKDLLRAAHQQSREQPVPDPPDSSARKEDED